MSIGKNHINKNKGNKSYLDHRVCKGTGTKAGLPRHGRECVGSCLHAGMISRHESR